MQDSRVKHTLIHQSPQIYSTSLSDIIMDDELSSDDDIANNDNNNTNDSFY